VTTILVPAADAFASSVTYFPGIPGVEPPSAVYILDFTALPGGLPTPFEETVGNLTVTYTSLVPAAFTTQPATAIPTEPSPSPVLFGSSLPSAAPVLVVSFSSRIYGIGAAFLTQGPGPIVMGVNGHLNGISASGVVPPGLVYPEGFIALIPTCVCASDINSVLFYDVGDPAFTIRYIQVFQSIPEPSSIGLLAAGLSSFTILYRRQRRARRMVRSGGFVGAMQHALNFP
jgi:hypothetical protein